MQTILNYIHWGAIIILSLLLSVMLYELLFIKGGSGEAGGGKGMGLLVMIVLGVLLALLVALKFATGVYGNYGAFAIIFGLFLYFNYSKEIANLIALPVRLFVSVPDAGNEYFKDEPRRKIAKAIDNYDLEKLEQLLQNPPANINEADNAAHINLLDFARDRFGKYEQAPIHWQPVFDALIQAGTTIAGDGKGRIDTHVRDIGMMEMDMLHYFLEKGANPNAKNEEGQPLVLFIIQYGDDKPQKVESLLKYGLDLKKSVGNIDYLKNVTPLMAAAAKEEWGICKMLVEAGDDITYVNAEGQSLQTVLDWHETSEKERNIVLTAEYLGFKKMIQPFSHDLKDVAKH